MVGRSINVGATIGDSGADTARRAFSKADALIHLSVESATTTAQPGAPAVDASYIIPTGKTGANWAGFTTGHVAVYRGTSYTDLSASGYWETLAPNEGWRAWVRDTDREVIYNSAAWDSSIEHELAKQRAAGQLSGFRNALINGAFNIWQRGTSFAAAGSGQFCADRWSYEKSGAMVHTLSRSTDVPTVAQAGRLFNYSLLVDCTTVDAAIAAGDYCLISHNIEGFNWAPLAQRATALSFWVKATKVGIYCVSLRNSGNDRGLSAEFTINVTDTWEFKTVTLIASPSTGTWDYTTGVGVRLSFALAVGSTFQAAAGAWVNGAAMATANQVNACDSAANNFSIAGVQLEACDATEQDATPFEHVPVGVEQALCERYFEKSFIAATAPAQNAGLTTGEERAFLYPSGAALHGHYLGFRQQKRATPTVTIFNPAAANAQARDITGSLDGSSTNAANVTDRGAMILWLGHASSVVGSQWGFHWTVNAEL